MKNALTVAAWLRIKPSAMPEWDEYDFSANEQDGFDMGLVRLTDARALLEAKDAEISALKAAPSRDTAALIEIDRVMLEAGAHWPDVQADALVVRHVKELTRMLNADRAAAQALRDQVRLAVMSGTDDFRRFYDAELFAVLGVSGFRDLYAPAGSVEAAQA